MDTYAMISLGGSRRITFWTYTTRASICVRIEKSTQKGIWETECEADGVPVHALEHVARVMRSAVTEKENKQN